jgi:hypothetical protein
MNLRKAFQFLAQEFILLLVFLSVAWLSAGTNPNESFLRGIFSYIYNLFPVTFFFWTLPALIIFFSIAVSYHISGLPGIIALIMVFFGELFKSSIAGIVLFLIGMFIGMFASMRE